MIPNQVRLSWKLSFSIAWALFWRSLVIGFIPAALLQHFTKTAGVFLGLLLSMGQIVLSLFVMAIAIWWLFEKDKRLGSLRVFLMEQAHYQQLASNLVQGDASPQSGSRS